MSRYDAAWGEEERAEHEALVQEVRRVDGNVARARAYRLGIEDAVQAHRPWARDVMDKVLYDEFLSRWKSVSREGVVLIVRDGQHFRKPKTWATSRVSDQGTRYTQDALIESLTRDDVEERLSHALKMSATYSNEARMWSAIRDFLDKAGVDDTGTAAARLGMSLGDWLQGLAA